MIMNPYLHWGRLTEAEVCGVKNFANSLCMIMTPYLHWGGLTVAEVCGV